MLSPRRFHTVLLLQSIILFSAVIGIRWEHSVDLNDDYRVLWTINKLPSMSQQQLLSHTQQQQSYLPHLTEITFEIQVRTLGYIGFGFSPDGQRAGSDIVIGWVDHGQTYFHVSNFLPHSRLQFSFFVVVENEIYWNAKTTQTHAFTNIRRIGFLIHFFLSLRPTLFCKDVKVGGRVFVCVCVLWLSGTQFKDRTVVQFIQTMWLNYNESSLFVHFWTHSIVKAE